MCRSRPAGPGRPRRRPRPGAGRRRRRDRPGSGSGGRSCRSPTPALAAMSRTGASTPEATKTAAAASSRVCWLRRRVGPLPPARVHRRSDWLAADHARSSGQPPLTKRNTCSVSSKTERCSAFVAMSLRHRPTGDNRIMSASTHDPSRPSARPPRCVSVARSALPAPGRGEDLQVRVSAPVTGSELPVIVFSHGFGWSLNGYAPLVDFWAAHGFVVVQPTHLDSRTLEPPARRPPYAADLALPRRGPHSASSTSSTSSKPPCPASAGASTASRVAVAGHSWGGQTREHAAGRARPRRRRRRPARTCPTPGSRRACCWPRPARAAPT